MYEDILWPCPVRWEWENGYGGWLPFYYSPTLEFVAGDPLKATKVPGSKTRAIAKTSRIPQYDY